VAVNDSSQRLHRIVRRLTDALDQLSQHAVEMAALSDALREIGDQTHLLALNAAIEAAGAGANGARFAVIANEVRELASQALRATASFQRTAADMDAAATQALAATQDSGRGTDLSMELVARGTGAMERIAGLAQHTNDAVQAISRAVTEQQATNADLDRFATQVASSARQAAQASAALSIVAQDLTDVVGRLQESVGAFRLTTTGEGFPPAASRDTQRLAARAPIGGTEPAPVGSG
jgi:methyl-accepting chemotaxis protein